VITTEKGRGNTHCASPYHSACGIPQSGFGCWTFVDALKLSDKVRPFDGDSRDLFGIFYLFVLNSLNGVRGARLC
jgi:hypothetical protein